MIAGPTVGGYLARFGATVVKVDPSKPKYDPLVSVYMGLPANRGKKSLLTDLKTSDGRTILRGLTEWADVVLCNQARSQLKGLGCDEKSLKEVNPHIILMHFDAFGGPDWGPRSDFLGYDDNIQVTA